MSAPSVISPPERQVPPTQPGSSSQGHSGNSQRASSSLTTATPGSPSLQSNHRAANIPLVHQRAGLTVDIAQPKDLRLILGVKAKRRCLDIDQVDLQKRSIVRDGDVVYDIMAAYKQIRGWLRLWLSVYQLRYYSFRKVCSCARSSIERFADTWDSS